MSSCSKCRESLTVPPECPVTSELEHLRDRSNKLNELESWVNEHHGDGSARLAWQVLHFRQVAHALLASLQNIREVIIAHDSTLNEKVGPAMLFVEGKLDRLSHGGE